MSAYTFRAEVLAQYEEALAMVAHTSDPHERAIRMMAVVKVPLRWADPHGYGEWQVYRQIGPRAYIDRYREVDRD